MKKSLKFILPLFICLLFAFSFSACTFIKEDGGSDGSSVSYSTYYTDRVLVDSATLAEDNNVTVGYGDHTTPYDTLQEAANKVKRSSVALKVGNYYGSGVIVDITDDTLAANEVYVITCNHMVMDTGKTMTVYLPDTNFRYAENDNYIFSGTIGLSNQAVTLVGGDLGSDIAVLKLRINNPVVLNGIYKAKMMDKTYSLEYAEKIFSIGNPSGELPGTYSEGAVGYVNRVTGVDGVGDMTLIQISVFSNHGSSGGGLYNQYGELVGITNAGSDAYEGLNFAIPHCVSQNSAEDNGFINIAENLIGSAASLNGHNYGYVSGRRYKIGYTISESSGKVVISALSSGSMAEALGMKVGDIVTKIKILKTGITHDVTDYNALVNMLNGLSIGDKYELTFVRNNTAHTVSLGVYQFYLYNTGYYLTA